MPSPSDLAANGAPVYLDEVPQCAGLTASQCEDLLSGEYRKVSRQDFCPSYFFTFQFIHPPTANAYVHMFMYVRLFPTFLCSLPTFVI